jgi:hypothetical protein
VGERDEVVWVGARGHVGEHVDATLEYERRESSKIKNNKIKKYQKIENSKNRKIEKSKIRKFENSKKSKTIN